MRHPVSKEVAFVAGKQLRLSLQSAKRWGMDNTCKVAPKGRPVILRASRIGNCYHSVKISRMVEFQLSHSQLGPTALTRRSPEIEKSRFAGLLSGAAFRG